MASLYALPILILFLFVNLTFTHVSAHIVFEEGYTVTTVLDGNKQNVNPHSILPLPGSSDLIILDSSNSSLYTGSFNTSQDIVIKGYAGTGFEGYLDGDLGSATFNKPKSFAVDSKGNVYVADMKNNHAIRKISKSGVTTIAGGYSSKPGRADGPAQNASFSDDIELAFIPESCALMIADHGNKLVRRIDLKPEDCASGSQSGLGMAYAWALGLVGSCLVSFFVGFVIRPYIPLNGGFSPLRYSETWKHFLISLGSQVPMFYFDVRSAVASPTLFAFLRRLIMLGISTLSLMFRHNVVESQTLQDKYVSLLDSDRFDSCELTRSQVVAEQLKGLITSDGGLDLLDPRDKNLKRADENKEMSDGLSKGQGKIDDMIQSNILGFVEQAQIASLVESRESGSGLVKRR
ncbi:unnamed protein product [Ilex paraguariensis]|uniref:NHL repeat-containing protein n=1 Tax=Ilex paraguariensis TaxID=185542 RepID=A0ABC8UNN0_9AQUA